MRISSVLVLVCALAVSQGQKIPPCSLAQELNNYCDVRCESYCDNISLVSEPRGSQGPPGQAGIVNYTAIEEMIRRAVYKALQQHQTGAEIKTTPLPTATVETTESRTTTPEPTNMPDDGWTVFQRRRDGSVDFNRNWDDYVNGFGDENGEFWMGLEKLHQLTSNGNYELRIDLKDWKRNSAFAKYSGFSVGSASTNYHLSVSEYSGTAGDSFISSQWIHNGMAFSTKDNDNDRNDGSCAERLKGGWWFNACFSSNLNGVYHRRGRYTRTYGNGIVWYPWKNDFWYSMKFVEMKLRPVQ